MPLYSSLKFRLTAFLLSLLLSSSPAQEWRSVEQLPVDRFDLYRAGGLPPYPWREMGKIGPGVALSLHPDGESDFVRNKTSGKGLVLQTQKGAKPTGVGVSSHFIAPPAGPLYLGFDFRLQPVEPNGTTPDLLMTLGTAQKAIVRLRAGAGAMTWIGEDGVEKIATKLDSNVWYHVAISISEKGVPTLSLVDARQKTRSTPLGSFPAISTTALTRLQVSAGSDSDNGGGWALDNICMSGKVDASREAFLPFKPATANKLNATKRKVFAYYYPVYPADGANVDPGLSYYVLALYNPDQARPDRKDAGGPLLYIPLPRPAAEPMTKEEALIRSAEDEVRIAKQMGLDGFLVDFQAFPKESNNTKVLNDRAFALMTAANRVDPTFKIIPAIYGPSSQNVIKGEGDVDGSPIDYARSPVVQQILAQPNLYRLDDGRVVLSSWLPERYSTDWWKQALAELNKMGHSIAFVPQFNSTGRLTEFAPICEGMEHWGRRSPVEMNWIELARPLTKIVALSICAQDIRARGCSYWEAENSSTLRSLWMEAIDKKADWAILNTWSDYSEQAMAPSTTIGYAMHDLNTYYLQWFKSGVQPPITKDVLYYIYRPNRTDVPHRLGKDWTVQRDQGRAATPHNDIELLAFLTAPGTLGIDINGKLHTLKAEAGIVSFKVPIPAGETFAPVFSLARGEKTILRGTGRFTVQGKTEYPQLFYHAGIIAGNEDDL